MTIKVILLTKSNDNYYETQMNVLRLFRRLMHLLAALKV